MRCLNPHLAKLWDDLISLKNQTPHIEKIQKELRSLHKEYSGFIHMTIHTLSEFNNFDLRKDYAFFQSYKFNQQRFDETIFQIWRVIDILFSLLLTTASYYYCAKSPKDYVTRLTTFYGKDAFALKPLNDKLLIKKMPVLNTIIS